jgi:bile acid:Na+ symporter, BASS family
MSLTAFVNILTTIALMALMVSIGLRVRLKEVFQTACQVRLVVMSVVANFVLVPLFMAGLLYLFQTPPLVSAGFLILAVCPGAPIGPPVTVLAKGNVPIATGAMVILAGLSALLAPVILTILLEWLSPGSEVRIDSLEITKILMVTQLLPLGVGFGLCHWTPGLAELLVKPVGSIANVLLFSVVGLIVATQYHTLEAFQPRGWMGMFLLLVVSLATGWFCGGTNRAIRCALAVTAGLRNAAVGLVIVTTNFAGTPAVTAVVAYALVSTFGTLGCAIILGKMTLTEIKTEAA